MTTIVEAQNTIKKERARLKKEGASISLLQRLEDVSHSLAVAIEQIKYEGFDPEGAGI